MALLTVLRDTDRSAAIRLIPGHAFPPRPFGQIDKDRRALPYEEARRFHTAYGNTAYTPPAHSVRKGLAGFDRSITRSISCSDSDTIGPPGETAV